jgi:aminomethyltransferase
VGLVGVERVPVREGTALFDTNGASAGTVCSGTLGPSVNQCVAMAYVPAALAAVGTTLHAEVRGKRVPMTVSAMPFHPHRYKR